jgi:gas vesicle protein
MKPGNKKDRSPSAGKGDSMGDRGHSEQVNKKSKVDYNDMKVADIMLAFKDELNTVAKRMEDKLDNIEDRISNRIVTQVSQDIAKQIKDNVEKVVREKVGSMKAEIMKDINDLKKNIEDVQQQARQSDDRHLNFVVYNYEESSHEDVEKKVNALVREGLKLNVKVGSCKGLKSRREHTPGMIIVTCKNDKDKEAIMKAKPNLRDSRNFGNIRISHDKSPEARAMNSNLKVILQEIGEDRYELRGNRLIRRPYHPAQDQEDHRYQPRVQGSPARNINQDTDQYKNPRHQDHRTNCHQERKSRSTSPQRGHNGRRGGKYRGGNGRDR